MKASSTACRQEMREKASERITVRFTPSEREQVVGKAGTRRGALSEFARFILLANSRIKNR